MSDDTRFGFEPLVGQLSIEERNAAKRFWECVSDGQPYDVPLKMMGRLAEIGVVEDHGDGQYSARSDIMAAI